MKTLFWQPIYILFTVLSWHTAIMNMSKQDMLPTTASSIRGAIQNNNVFIYSLSWGKNNLLGAGLSNGKLQGWHVDPKSGKISHKVKFRRKHGKSTEVVSWSPNGKYLLSGADVAGTRNNDLKIWHYDNTTKELSNKPVYEFKTDGLVSCADWANENLLASGTVSRHQQIKIWDLKKSYSYETSADHGNIVEAIKWNHSSSLFATGALARKEQLKIWKVKQQNEIELTCSKDLGHEVVTLEWSPNDRFIAAANYQGILTIWKCDKEGRISDIPLLNHNFGRSFISLGWSSTGYLAIAIESSQGTRLEIIEINGSAKVNLLHKSLFSSSIQTLSWSPNGNCLAIATNDNKISIWKFLPQKQYLSLASETTIC